MVAPSSDWAHLCTFFHFLQPSYWLVCGCLLCSKINFEFRSLCLRRQNFCPTSASGTAPTSCSPVEAYNLKGTRFSLGVVPRELRSGRPLPGVCGSTDRLGVCIPDGVDVPLVFLVGAGEAAPDAVLEETPLVVVVVLVVPLVDPTDNRDGLGVVVVVTRRVGILDGVASSVLSRESVEP